ncbi:MAG: palindromic element RPE4 domain-containing protein [Rickettsia conorii subsp. raoultii]
MNIVKSLSFRGLTTESSAFIKDFLAPVVKPWDDISITFNSLIFSLTTPPVTTILLFANSGKFFIFS